MNNPIYSAANTMILRTSIRLQKFKKFRPFGPLAFWPQLNPHPEQILRPCVIPIHAPTRKLRRSRTIIRNIL